MFNIGMPELLVILVIALILFGAGRLPQIGEGLGRAIRSFKKGLSEDDSDRPPSSKDDHTSH